MGDDPRGKQELKAELPSTGRDKVGMSLKDKQDCQEWQNTGPRTSKKQHPQKMSNPRSQIPKAITLAFMNYTKEITEDRAVRKYGKIKAPSLLGGG